MAEFEIRAQDGTVEFVKEYGAGRIEYPAQEDLSGLMATGPGGRPRAEPGSHIVFGTPPERETKGFGVMAQTSRGKQSKQILGGQRPEDIEQMDEDGNEVQLGVVHDKHVPDGADLPDHVVTLNEGDRITPTVDLMGNDVTESVEGVTQ